MKVKVVIILGKGRWSQSRSLQSVCCMLLASGVGEKRGGVG